MKPIINPWLFYLIDVIYSFIILIVMIALLIFISIAIDMIKYWEAKLDKVKVIKTIKKKVVVIALLITFVIFIPSRKTCYQMIIASHITDTNIQKAEDVVKDSVDYIFEKINER